MSNSTNKEQALHNFWASFGIQAIDEQSAYDERTVESLNLVFPYITYEVGTASFDEQIALGADVWDNSTSWTKATEKAEQIAEAIGRGGIMVAYDGGALWITRGAPFSQRMAAETGYDVRRIHININAEFLSA